MRCQLVHGAATYGGKLNRTSLKHCVTMMQRLLPAMLLVWIDHGADEDWGPMCYPPVGVRRVDAEAGGVGHDHAGSRQASRARAGDVAGSGEAGRARTADRSDGQARAPGAAVDGRCRTGCREGGVRVEARVGMLPVGTLFDTLISGRRGVVRAQEGGETIVILGVRGMLSLQSPEKVLHPDVRVRVVEVTH